MKRPVNVAAGLESVYSVTSCVFSPDDQLVSTGTSVRKGQVRVTCLSQNPSVLLWSVLFCRVSAK